MIRTAQRRTRAVVAPSHNLSWLTDWNINCSSRHSHSTPPTCSLLLSDKYLLTYLLCDSVSCRLPFIYLSVHLWVILLFQDWICWQKTNEVYCLSVCWSVCLVYIRFQFVVMFVNVWQQLQSYCELMSAWCCLLDAVYFYGYVHLCKNIKFIQCYLKNSTWNIAVVDKVMWVHS